MKSTILITAITAFSAAATKLIAESDVAVSLSDISVSPEGRIMALAKADYERNPQTSGSLAAVIVLKGKPKEVQKEFDELSQGNPCIRPLALLPLSKGKDADSGGVILVLGQHQP